MDPQQAGPVLTALTGLLNKQRTLKDVLLEQVSVQDVILKMKAEQEKEHDHLAIIKRKALSTLSWLLGVETHEGYFETKQGHPDQDEEDTNLGVLGLRRIE